MERVGPPGFRVAQVVLDDERARQGERVARHPGAGHHGAVTAAEVLRIGQLDAGTGPSAEQPLGGSQRSEHRPGDAAQVANHRLRPYPADSRRPPRRRTPARRETTSTAIAATTIPARFTPSWNADCAACAKLPSTSATEARAAAGTVVTEMNTPTRVADFAE